MSDDWILELPPLDLKGSLLAVALGGAVGTLVRTLILNATSTSSLLHISATSSQPSTSDWSSRIPWALLAINTVGVMLAAWLLAGPLYHRSPDDRLRLFVITGVLGGLTSYSSLFVALGWIKQASLVGAGATLVGAVIAGIAAALLGVKVARR